MTEPGNLSTAEREVRAYAADSGDAVLRRHLTAVMRKYDRLRGVEKAAAAYIELRTGPGRAALDYVPREARLFMALARAVRKSVAAEGRER